MVSREERACNKCCKKADLYANPVTLTYNKQRVFQTGIGGCMTITSALILIGWTFAQLNNSLLSMKYDLTSRQYLSLIDGTTESGTVYNISSDQLVPAYLLLTLNGTIFNDKTDGTKYDNLTDYISVVYQQTTYNSTDPHPIKVQWYNSTLCSNVITNPALKTTLANFFCPDIHNNTITLQGDAGKGTEINLAAFTIIVDTCDKLKNITYKADCQSFKDPRDVQYVMVGSKIAHQFFDASTFIENNGEVLYTRNYEAKTLQNGVVAQQFVNI